MKKYQFGIIVWLLLGIFSVVLGWTHFLTWTIGTYIWEIFVTQSKLNDTNIVEPKKEDIE